MCSLIVEKVLVCICGLMSAAIYPNNCTINSLLAEGFVATISLHFYPPNTVTYCLYKTMLLASVSAAQLHCW